MFITYLHRPHRRLLQLLSLRWLLVPPGRAPVLVYGPGPAGVCRQVKSTARIQPSARQPDTGPCRGHRSAASGVRLHQQHLHRDYGIDALRTWIQKSRKCQVPPGSDYRNRAPKMRAFSGRIGRQRSVTATLVSHYDVYPAFRFRFDLKKSNLCPLPSRVIPLELKQLTVTLAQGTRHSGPRGGVQPHYSFTLATLSPNYLVNSHTSAERWGRWHQQPSPKQT